MTDIGVMRALVAARLAERRAAATELLRDVLTDTSTDPSGAAGPVSVLIAEYLLGLDHSVLLYAQAADGSSAANSAVVFAGIAGDLAAVEAADARLASEARHDDDIHAAVEEWFEQCWREAGGAAGTLPFLWMLEGDNEAYDLRTGLLVTPP